MLQTGQVKWDRERLQQLRAATKAYGRLVPQDPPLPSADSPLPALLALRCTLTTIYQSKKAIHFTHDIAIDRQRDLWFALEVSEDTQVLSRGLQDRIKKLHVEEGEQSKRKPADIASDLVNEQRKRSSRSRIELRDLVKAFNEFVNDHLAIMLAAEELGGPIVGDALELDEGDLEAGFTQLGKPKKIGHKTDALEKKRLTRNSQLWGDEYVRDRVGKPVGEVDAAGASFRDLTEDLLNAFAEPDEPNTYVRIAKENAAVRFLIRANVVQFNPDDARKIRLR